MNTETQLAEDRSEQPSKQTAIATPVELPAGVSPIVAMVASGQYSPEILQQMLDVQKNYEADQARKAFAVALAKFRKIAPSLKMDRTVGFASKKPGGSDTSYKHTSLGYAMTTVNPLLGECGLNISWHPSQDSAMISVETRLTHELGHYESISLTSTLDNSGNKNGLQAIKSTITYLQRTGAFSLLGLASEYDDDGAGGPPIQETAAPEPPAEPEIYSQTTFDKKFPQWSALVKSGEKTSASIIDQISSRCNLTQDQMKKIETLAEIKPDRKLPELNYEFADDAEFKARYAEWRIAVEAGDITASELMDKVDLAGKLTNEQVVSIENLQDCEPVA